MRSAYILFSASATVLFLALLQSSTPTAKANNIRYAGEGKFKPFYDGLKLFDHARWFIADYSVAGDWLAVRWDRGALNYSALGQRVDLLLDPAPPGKKKPFLGAELQRRGLFGYGRYEVVMRAAHGPGIVSSFFTYTGKYYGTPHDEIDIEFTGKDTTKVELNYFVGGNKFAGKKYRLGFDASKQPYLYAFEWREDSIVWYVGDKEVWRRTSADSPMPSHASLIMMNLWAGGPGMQDWLGPMDPAQHARASYYCVSYRPFGSNLRQCSDTVGPQLGGKKRAETPSAN